MKGDAAGLESSPQSPRLLQIPPGDYLIGIVREFDHFAGESRRVFD